MGRLVLLDYKMSYFENNGAKRCLGLSIVSFAIVLFSLLMPTPQAFAQCTTICFDAASGPTDLSTYTPGDVAIIRVTDPVFAGNGNSDTVIVTVSSADFLGTPIDNVLLTLTEVGDTGIFKNKALTFSYTHTNYQVNSFLQITQDIDSNPLGTQCIGGAVTNTTTLDTLCGTVTSTSSPTGIPILELQERSDASNHFVNQLKLTPKTPTGSNEIKVSNNDVLSITFNGATTNALISPTDPGVKELLVSSFDGFDIPSNTVTVSYGATIATVDIDPSSQGGGSGTGGLLVPGTVLEFIYSLGLGGSPYIVSPPSFGGGYYHYSDGLTLTQGDTTTTFDTSLYNQEIPKQVMVSGEKVNMKFKTFESYNLQGIIHMGLYIIPRGQDMITDNSIASIVWDKGQPVEVSDPNHILADATVYPTDDDKFQYTTFSFTPTKSYDKMSFLVRAWNDHLYSTDIRVHDDIVAPQAAKTLPAGVIQYDNFDHLQAALEKDQFYKPQLLSHIHGTSDVFPNSEGGSVYWLYDTIQHTVTLVIADKNYNVLSSQSASLQPYAAEKKGDYKFMYFTVQQLNRWNEDQLKNAMEVEAAKAMSSALEKKIILHSNW